LRDAADSNLTVLRGARREVQFSGTDRAACEAVAAQRYPAGVNLPCYESRACWSVTGTLLFGELRVDGVDSARQAGLNLAAGLVGKNLVRRRGDTIEGKFGDVGRIRLLPR